MAAGRARSQHRDRVTAGWRTQTSWRPAPACGLFKLDFFKPFEGHNTAEFTLEARGDSTTVTWAMHGPSPSLSKLMGLVFNMDRMVGGQFEQGLANLKAVAGG